MRTVNLVKNYTTKRAGETRNILVDLSDKLDTDELLSGTATVVEVLTSALTIASVALSEERTVNGAIVPASTGVSFSVSGGVARTDYTIRITVSTDATPAQLLIQDIRLQVK